jgi:hypothetical protein
MQRLAVELDRDLPRGRGLVHGALLPAAVRVPALRRHLLSVLSARFA